jgi:hypothetical protein
MIGAEAVKQIDDGISLCSFRVARREIHGSEPRIRITEEIVSKGWSGDRVYVRDSAGLSSETRREDTQNQGIESARAHEIC